MFQGASKLMLDAKGRMAVPSRHRDALKVQCEGRLTITKHPHGCLLLFPRPVWENHREQINAWPMAARNWQRIFLGNANDVEMDGSGRVLITPEQRETAGMKTETEVMLMGMGSHFEIWNLDAVAKQEVETVAQGIPDVLSTFSF